MPEGNLADKTTSTSSSSPAATGPLEVTQGQVTFDAEGNDIRL